MSLRKPPLIVGIGGTLRQNSTSELALKIALGMLEQRGARVLAFSGPDLNIPAYEDVIQGNYAEKLISAVREADGIILASPCYHGGVSGMVKNAIDHIELLRKDARPYLDGRVVGCIATGAGNQGPAQVLGSLRAIVHALRGWPAPLGISVNTLDTKIEGGEFTDAHVQRQFELMTDQVANFLHLEELTPRSVAV